jgi:hypothetical protein
LQKKIEKIKRKIPDAGPAHRCQRGWRQRGRPAHQRRRRGELTRDWGASLHKPPAGPTLAIASARRAQPGSRELASPPPGISIPSLLSREATLPANRAE